MPFPSMPYFNGAMTGANLKEYVKEFNGEMTTFRWQSKRCHDPKVLKIAEAITLTERAYVEYKAGNDEWENNLNRANHKLAKCTVDFFGEPNGGSCQTLEEKNIAYKVKWKTPAVQ